MEFDCRRQIVTVYFHDESFYMVYTTSIIYNLNFLCYDDDIIKRKAERHRFQKGKRHDCNESLVLPL